jgi:hypothetical protein
VPMRSVLTAILCVVCANVIGAQSSAIRLVRSVSGPSGKVVGDAFVIDDVRSRFVYPQDSALAVYFEWQAPAGEHVLVASWRQPDGRVATVSPDVRMTTTSEVLRSYWTFPIGPGRPAGPWSVDIRIDGQPAGSHVFELVGDALQPAFTLDRAFSTYSPSMVSVYRLDDAGRRIDKTSGFVIAQDTVATAFQSIDATLALEIEFSDGHRVPASDIYAASRTGDWALVKVATGALAPLPRAQAGDVRVGERVAEFGVETDGRTISPADISGIARPAGYAPRLRMNPPTLRSADVGGPVIDERGHVVAIIGASLTPGLRIDQRQTRLTPWISNGGTDNAAVPISELPQTVASGTRTMDQLLTDKVLTTPLSPMPEFVSGKVGSSAGQPSAQADGIPEFSSRDDAKITVSSVWAKRKTTKQSKGTMSVTLYDVKNEPRGGTKRQVNLASDDQTFSIAFSPRDMAPGYYRVDTEWNGTPAWRTYVKIID